MKSKILLVLTLVTTTSWGQKLTKTLLFTETFMGDTFDPVITNMNQWETKTVYFDGLTIRSGGKIGLNPFEIRDRWYYKYVTVRKTYDSLMVEISFAHRVIDGFPSNNTVWWYNNPDTIGKWHFNDGDTHLVIIPYHNEHLGMLTFNLSPEAYRVYVNHLRIYGYKTDTTVKDTPTTGLHSELGNSVNIRHNGNEIVFSNDKNDALSIIVRDMSGKDIKTLYTSSTKGTLLISQPGIYAILIMDEKGNSLIKKIVIQ